MVFHSFAMFFFIFFFFFWLNSSISITETPTNMKFLQCNSTSGAVIPYNYRSNSRQNMILDYNENSTAQYMYKQAVIHTKLSNRLYPIQYISQHDTARQYRTCIMDSDMASVLIRSLCIKHLILNNVYCMS